MTKQQSNKTNDKANRAYGWKASLARLLTNEGKYTVDGKKFCSYATRQARREHLYPAFQDLRELGFKLQDVHNLKGKHVFALAQHYVQRLQDGTMSVATIVNRFSHLRVLSIWIKKEGLVKPIEHYVPGISLRRTINATEAKTWTAKGKKPEDIIKNVEAQNKRVGLALRLGLEFGLRSKESLLLRPHLADKGNVLYVTHGTKGGRDRYIEIETEAQRHLLDEIKQLVGLDESLVPKGKTYASFRRYYYRLLNNQGISREDGITPHGLRHEHLNNLYEKITGEKSPVQGGNLSRTEKDKDNFARQLVAERAGHGRLAVSGAYLGGKRTPKSD